MRINVLDHGFVELQDMMGNDLAIVNAARVSYLGESKGEEADWKLLRYLMRNGHTSPCEMVEFKFRISAPIIVIWQMVRTRTASINMQSGRYTEYDDSKMYYPSEWRGQSKTNKQGSDGVIDERDAFHLDTMLRVHYEQSYDLYQDALERGVAREQARLFLPAFAMYHDFIWKIDAHNLMRFLEQRLDSHAQWEIRQYAEAIWEIFQEKLPVTAEAFKEYRLKVGIENG